MLSVSTRRVRQMKAEGKLPFVVNEDGSASYPQTAIHAYRRRKSGAEISPEAPPEVIDLRTLQIVVTEVIEKALPKAIESATSADRIAREQAQAALFEANARAAAAQARVVELEAQIAEASTKRRWLKRAR